MNSDDAIAQLVQTALGQAVLALEYQSLAQSGNVVARARLADGISVAVRISPRRKTFDSTRLNLDALRHAGLPVPRVLARGLTSTGGAYVILEWLPGHDLLLALPLMSAEQMVQAARRVFEFQQRVGQLPVGSSFGWGPLRRGGGLARWSDVFGPNGVAAATDDSVSGHGAVRLQRLRPTLEPYFETVRAVCFLDDLTVKNVLIDDGLVSGLIDIDEVCYGDPLLAVGQTLACLDCDVGAVGRPYGQALLDSWNPQGEALRALRFYRALWTNGFLSQAQASGDQARVERIGPLAQATLAAAEA